MSGNIEISRELAERITKEPCSVDDQVRRQDAVDELRAILAAPVVERQPIGFVTRREGRYGAWLHKSWEQAKSFDSTAINGKPGNSEILAAYTSPPAPVAVVTREQVEIVAESIYWQWDGREGFVPWVKGGNSLKQDEARSIAWATLDKLKELNQ